MFSHLNTSLYNLQQMKNCSELHTFMLLFSNKIFGKLSDHVLTPIHYYFLKIHFLHLGCLCCHKITYNTWTKTFFFLMPSMLLQAIKLQHYQLLSFFNINVNSIMNLGKFPLDPIIVLA